MPHSPRAAVELFHLLFLRALVAKGEDKGLFALKGGSNLRFFFGSVRYSEDIDLDVAVVAKGTLTRKVDQLLRSPAVLSPLRARSIELVDVSAPKQTDTTQRWKAGLQAQGLSARTKIEFSRRGPIAGAAFEAVNREVLVPHAMTPFLATHYATRAAIIQKVGALAGRKEPQARDVFDLNLLIARPDAAITFSGVERRSLAAALDSAISVSFADYTAQVVAYLHPAQAELFAGRDAWNVMQGAVVEWLHAAAR